MNIKKLISLSLVGSMLSYMVFIGTEAQVAKAVTDGFNVDLSVTAEISLNCPDTTISENSIQGLTGGTSTVKEVCTVITNNATGYSLAINATSSPAMRLISDPGNFSFDDHQLTNSFNFAYTTASSVFGYSVSSTNAASSFKNDGAGACGGSNVDDAHCFTGLTTSPVIVVQSSDPTTVSGAPTEFNFEAAVGSSKNQKTGAYRATIVVTALTLP